MTRCWGVEARAQLRLQPGVEDLCIARALEEQGLCESPFHTGRNARGPGPSMPGDQTVHTVALIHRDGRAVCRGE